jgi:hypothetical protein
MSRVLLHLTLITCAAVETEPAKLATADAAPVDPGAIEVAAGWSYTTASRTLDADGNRRDRGGRATEHAIGIGLTAGIVEGLDAGVGLGWAAVTDAAADPDDGSGPTDIELGAKWAFWQGEAAAVAVLPGATLPLGRDQDPADGIPTASRFATIGGVLAASGTVEGCSWNCDAGYVHACGSHDDRAGYRGTWVADVAVGYVVAEGVQPEVDLSWARDRVAEGEAPWSLTATAGVQVALPIGRLGAGAQQVVAGALVDAATAVVVDWACMVE